MDDLRTTMMRMLSSRTGDASAQLQKLLLARINQRPPGDPLRDIFAAMLAQRHSEAESSPPQPQVLLRAARDALNVLQQRNAAIAAALGGCPECLGLEADCPRCKGQGRPGWVAPDPAAFATWVSPAVRAMEHSAKTATDQEANGPRSDAHNTQEGAMVP